MGTKTWTAVEIDVVKALRAKTGKLDLVELPRTLELQVVLELDEELYKDLKANPTWLQKLQTKAKEGVDDGVREAVRLLENAEKDAEKERERTAAEALGKKLKSELEDVFEAVGKDVAKAAGKLVEDYTKADKELSRYKAKAVAKIVVTAVTVAAGALLSVASQGALSPIGWISVVRGGMTIVKDLDKLASDTESTAAAIRKELKFLKGWLDDNIDAETKKGKLEKTAKEVGLTLMSKALNVNLPSVKTCEEHIALHGKNVTKLERDSKKLSESLYAAMDAQEAWSKEFDKAKRNLPAPAVGKVKTQLEKAEQSLDALIKKIIEVNESVAAAEKQGHGFELALEALRDGLPNWARLVDSAVSLAVDLVTGLQDADSTLEKAVSVISALAQAAADEGLTAK
jgi:uncharacterized protein (DUF885 family)